MSLVRAYRLLALILFLTTPAAAAPKASQTWWGHPDLQGLWTNASLTGLERPATFKTLDLTEVEASAFEASHSGAPVPPDTVGQAESEWWEMSGRLARIGGKPRSSWIVDPSDGKLPYTEAGRAALQKHRAALLTRYEHPELRPAAERCLAGVGGTSGAPMLNAGYSNLITIHQTRDHVVLLTEMNHDARIVPLSAQPSPPGGSWLGHSTGRWEGATLVIETAGFHPQYVWRTPAPLVMSDRARVIERLTRVSPTEIHYTFVVEDPAYLARPWRGEMPLRASEGPMFEFACHEGNYSLEGILAGERQKETAAR